ncbi:MAG: excinuclease ABC subunit UvrA, partial [Spirochaetes bacterium]|nr:excinuclease ABC subunit UvrA [Spirochaetota bacterium]
MKRSPIRVAGARQNNLKSISVEVPLGAVTVVTGVAGAGKSSLAMEVLYAEGYRQYVETFSPYARQFLAQLERPHVDEIEGILPAIAVGRAGQVRTSRSTVGTITSVDDYLRPLFAQIAVLRCGSCGRRVEEESSEGIAEKLLARYPGERLSICFDRPIGNADAQLIQRGLVDAGFNRIRRNGTTVALDEAEIDDSAGQVTVVVDRLRVREESRQRLRESLDTALAHGRERITVFAHDGQEATPLPFSTHLHCAYCDISYRHPSSADFSFNNPVGACPTCRGFGRVIDIDPDLVIPDTTLSIAEGAVRPFQSASFEQGHDDMLDYARAAGIPTDKPWVAIGEENRRRLWDGDEASGWYGIHAFFRYLEGKRYRKHARILLSRYRRYLRCPDCEGTRLKPYAGLFLLQDERSFPEMQGMMVGELRAYFDAMDETGFDRPTQILIANIRDRLGFLDEVGLGYLSLGRQARTLSGGETQRVTLATAIGAALSDTLYVLDEPSVGLHTRDKDRLAEVLKELARHSNAVVVVENDWPFIRGADRVIDIGPGAGQRGGRLLYEGPVRGFLTQQDSPTVRYLREDKAAPKGADSSRVDAGRAIQIRGAEEHNLQRIDVSIPLNALVSVTGVSGSGKSTLVDDVLFRNILREQGQAVTEPGRCAGLAGLDQISRAVLVDQTPLSRSSRMTAATYLKVLDPLRRAFAQTEGAKRRKLDISAFSYNSAMGACPNCGGSGFEQIELQFLPDAYVRCPVCNGRRFRGEVLEVTLKGRSISEVLDLSADGVLEEYGDLKGVSEALEPLIDLGLGYLSLGQPAPTLSGGEAQRLKLARFLSEARKSEHTLFILDEPTAGLHHADIALLIGALEKLIDAGHSAVVVDHSLRLLSAADWVIDMGPEGGDDGGRLLFTGTPQGLLESDSPTAQSFRAYVESGGAERADELPDADAPEAFGRDAIRIVGAREHNLRNVSVELPQDSLIAVTGVSGSGKSSLAFDVLYSEGRRRFLDCLPAYAQQFTRQLSRPEVDAVEAVPPTVALEQKISRAATRATVGTTSEVYHYLRLL